MKIRSRRAGALIAAAAVMALLAGCSSATSGSGSSGASGSGAISAWGVSGGVDEQLWKDSFDKWNKANPASKIDYQFFSNNAFKDKIRTAIGAGKEPTLIFNWSGGTLQDYVANNKVLDIGAGTKAVRGRVLSSVAQAGVIDGKVYAVPNSESQPVLLYYNKQLFDKVGITVPKTWPELLDSVTKFKAAGITPFALGGASSWTYLMWIEYLSDRVGGPAAFQAVLDGKKNAWSNPAFAQALKDIQDLVKDGAFGSGYASVSGDQSADLALLYTGKAAMVLQGSWAYPTFKADAATQVADGDLAATTFPTVANGAGNPKDIVGNLSNYWSVSASASKKQVQTAENYMNKDVFSNDYTSFLLKGGGVPPVAGLESQLATQKDAKFLTTAYGMVRDAPHFQLSWDQALPPTQAQALLTNLGQIFVLQITPKQFVTNMNATLGGK